MKKILTLAVMAAAALSAAATDYVVYNNGTLATTLEFNHWWNAAWNPQAEDPTEAAVKVFSVYPANYNAPNPGAAGGSMGIMTTSDKGICGPLHSATLEFSWYATKACSFNVRLTATGQTPEQDITVKVTEENVGKWNTASYPVAENFPDVAKFWDEFKGQGAGFVFSVIINNDAPDGAVLYFNNIKYTNIDETWQAPAVEELSAPETVPTYDYAADDVMSLLSKQYTAATTFNFGQWGSPTTFEIVTIDGAPVWHVNYFTYFGWEFAQLIDASAYNYLHVDYYPVKGTTFGFTPITTGAEKANNYSDLKLNEWNSFDVPLSYYDTAKMSDIFQMKYDNGQSGQGYIANVFFYKKDGGNEPIKPEEPVVVTRKMQGSFNGTVSQTTTEGEGDDAHQVVKEYPYTAKWEGTWNEDNTITVSVTYTWINGEPVDLVGGSLNIDGQLCDFALTDGVRTATTKQTYEAGQKINIRTYLPMANGVVEDTLTASMSVAVDGIEAAEAAAEYYTLQGVKVANPEAGLYIRVLNGKAQKVVIR